MCEVQVHAGKMVGDMEDLNYSEIFRLLEKLSVNLGQQSNSSEWIRAVWRNLTGSF